MLNSKPKEQDFVARTAFALEKEVYIKRKEKRVKTKDEM